jgi:hypothetical protein
MILSCFLKLILSSHTNKLLDADFLKPYFLQSDFAGGDLFVFSFAAVISSKFMPSMDFSTKGI